MLSNGDCKRLLKNEKQAENPLVFRNKVGKNSRYFVGVFNKTIIPLALVGYEMIIANSYPTRTREIIVKYIYSLYLPRGVTLVAETSLDQHSGQKYQNR